MSKLYKRLTLSLAIGLVAHSMKTSSTSLTSSSSSSSSTPPPTSSSSISTSTAILDYDNDRYDGVYIKNLPSSKTKFDQLLDDSLRVWSDNGRKGVWLKIPVEKIELATVAISKGFELHSCEKDHLMLTTWVGKSSSTIPNQPHNSVGIGCICYDKKNRKILCVKEKHGGISDVYKIPTGAVDPSEDLSAATKRELMEETGIKGNFQGIVGFRHAHGFLNGKSDIFFICVIEPLTFDITMQAEELLACEWLELDEYFNQEWFKNKPLNEMMNNDIRNIIKAIDNNKLHDKILKEHILENGFRPGASSYHSYM